MLPGFGGLLWWAFSSLVVVVLQLLQGPSPEVQVAAANSFQQPLLLLLPCILTLGTLAIDCLQRDIALWIASSSFLEVGFPTSSGKILKHKDLIVPKFIRKDSEMKWKNCCTVLYTHIYSRTHSTKYL